MTTINAVQCNAVQFNAMQCNAMPSHALMFTGGLVAHLLHSDSAPQCTTVHDLAYNAVSTMSAHELRLAYTFIAVALGSSVM